jgi:hypothetical protein
VIELTRGDVCTLVLLSVILGWAARSYAYVGIRRRDRLSGQVYGACRKCGFSPVAPVWNEGDWLGYLCRCGFSWSERTEDERHAQSTYDGRWHP